MFNLNKNTYILAIGQALNSTVVSLLTLISSLSGHYLAIHPSLSTLPVTAAVLGSLIMMYPASVMMGVMGSRQSFLIKAGLGVTGGLISFLSLVINNFYVLILGTFIMGLFISFGQYYRFAAIESVENTAKKEVALSVVTGAGVLGGILGPYIGSKYANTFPDIPYAGSFLGLILICILIAFSQYWLSPDIGKAVTFSKVGIEKIKPLKKNKLFWMCTFICGAGFAVMTLAMNAAPISMHQNGLDIKTSSHVLQIHFIAMYLPSFFNPLIIKYIKVQGLIFAGIICSLIAISLTILTEQNYFIYMIELGLAGISWNFIFNGGTLLLTNTYNSSTKVRAQGLNSLIVYSFNIIASISAGYLVTTYNWSIVNLACLPLIVLVLVATIIYRSSNTELHKI